jgi:hypothetical protein
MNAGNGKELVPTVDFDLAGLVFSVDVVRQLTANPNLYAAIAGRKFSVGIQFIDHRLRPVQDVPVVINAIINVYAG